MKKFAVVLLAGVSALSVAGLRSLSAAPPGAAGHGLPSVVGVSASGLKKAIAARKGKLVVVNFWATWCMPCKAEMPALVQLQKKYASKGLALLLVSCDSPGDLNTKVRPYLRSQGASFSSVIVNGDMLDFAKKFDPGLKEDFGLPRFYVYNRKGKLIQSFANLDAPSNTQANLQRFEKRFKPLL